MLLRTGDNMNALVYVSGQRLRFESHVKSFVSDTEEFVRLIFCLNPDWDECTTKEVQFYKDGVYEMDVLDSNNSVFLPFDLTPGTWQMVLRGEGGSTVAVTDYCTFDIVKGIYDEPIVVIVPDGDGIETEGGDVLLTDGNDELLLDT